MGNRYGEAVWTDAQNQQLRDIWGKGEPISEMNRMPGRTLAAMRMQARRLSLEHRPPGPKATLRNAVIALLSARSLMSSRELADVLLRSQQSTDSVLRALHAAKSVRIAGYQRCAGRVVRLWGIGSAPDEIRPEPKQYVHKPVKKRTSHVQEGKVVGCSPKVAPVKVFRDPLTEAFFGGIAA